MLIIAFLLSLYLFVDFLIKRRYYNNINNEVEEKLKEHGYYEEDINGLSHDVKTIVPPSTSCIDSELSLSISEKTDENDMDIERYLEEKRRNSN